MSLPRPATATLVLAACAAGAIAQERVVYRIDDTAAQGLKGRGGAQPGVLRRGLCTRRLVAS